MLAHVVTLCFSYADDYDDLQTGLYIYVYERMPTICSVCIVSS